MSHSTSHSLRRNHISSIVISVLVNAVLIVVLLYAVQFPADDDKDQVSIRVRQEEDILTEDVTAPVNVEDITDTENTEMAFDSTLEIDTELMAGSETLTEVESTILPTTSPLPMMDIALQAGTVNLEGAGGIPGKGVAHFMGQQAEGERFAFIIDYSKSMNEERLAVMKHELYTAIEKIGKTGLVSILFFSGPTWRPDQDPNVIRGNWTTRSGPYSYNLRRNAEGPNPKWFLPHPENLAALKRLIYTTPVTYGTEWYHPLRFTLDMNPKPNVIFFMTDGQAADRSIEATLKMIHEIPGGSIQINTVGLGINEKNAVPLQIMAQKTGGNFRLYNREDLKEALEKLPPPPGEFSTLPLQYMSHSEVMRHSATRGAGPKRVPIPNDDVVTFEI